MNLTDNKIEISIGALVVVLVAGLAHLFGNLHSPKSADKDFTYEMPRPKSFQGSDFDLSGREIDRKYINPFVKKSAQAKAEEAKKLEAKKAAANAKKDNKTAKKDETKKPEVTARVVAGNPEKKWDANNWNNSAQSYSAYNANEQTQANEDQNKDDKMSPDQWRALILGQPTKANMDKLIAARNKGDVDSSTYYMIINDLLKSNKAENQTLGLYGAQVYGDAGAFVVVAQNQDHMDSTLQNKAEQFLMTYTQASRINNLASVLSSTDTVVLMKATAVVVAGYQAARNGTNISQTDNRNGRGSSVSPVASYQKFIPLFQKLAQSSDSTIAALANSALEQLRTA